MIVMLHVLTSLLFLSPASGTLVSRAQVRRTARFGADGAKRHQTLHVPGAARRTCGWRACGPFKMLELLLTIQAFILKNGHIPSIQGRHTTPLTNVPYSWDGSNRLFFWNDSAKL